MKKFIVFILIAVLMVLVLLVGSSCKTTEVAESVTEEEMETVQTNESETTVQTSEPETTKKELTIWAGPQTPNDQELWADVIAGFETNHPGVTINYVSTPWDTMKEKYVTAFATDDNPDILYSFTGGYVDEVMPYCYNYKEIFTNEEYELITNGVAESVLMESTLGDGTVTGIPYFGGGDAFAYNINLLKEAGFDRPPDTLEEQLEYAKALTKDLDNDGKIDQYGYGMLSYDTAEAKPEFFLYAYGYTLLNDSLEGIGYDDEGSLEAFKYIDQLWNIDKTAVPIGLYPGSTMVDAFFDNKFAMWICPSTLPGNLRDYPDFNLGVAEAPQGPGKALADGRGIYVGTGWWAIPKNVEDLELVKEWILYIYNQDIQKKICENYGLIAGNSQIEVELEPLFLDFSKSYLTHGIPYRFSSQLGEVKQIVWDAMAAVQSGKLTPEKAWQQAIDSGKAVFE